MRRQHPGELRVEARLDLAHERRERRLERGDDVDASARTPFARDTRRGKLRVFRHRFIGDIAPGNTMILKANAPLSPGEIAPASGAASDDVVKLHRGMTRRNTVRSKVAVKPAPWKCTGRASGAEWTRGHHSRVTTIDLSSSALTRAHAIPTVALAAFPSPIEELKRLREALGGGPRLIAKRDDAIPFGFGGNKVRKLAIVAAKAVADGADSLITIGGVQ